MKKTVQFLMLALLWTNAAFAQQALVGLVQDGGGAPVAGANVVVKGTNLFAVTESSGRFSLAVRQAPPFTLRVSSVGFKAREIQVVQLPAAPLEVKLVDDNVLNEVVVTARRRAETAQEVPVPISVVSGAAVEEAGAFNVNRIKELVPTVQLYSSNPCNTTLNIRGLGSTFGLTNDGIDPGVGFYVDGVYFARPAAATLDFIDIEQIEVLRGPQGTLFGKNTTAGAFNVTTRRPSFTPGANFEVSYSNYGFIQAKSSTTGPLGKKFAGRISFSGTQRDGVLYNVATGKSINDLNNLGVRGQLLFTPSNKVKILLIGDATDQNQQWTQEVRYAGDLSSRLGGLIGVFAIGQDLKTDPYHIEESGAAQWRFSQNSTSPLWQTPGLFDGYGIQTTSWLRTFGAAVFGQLDWAITKNVHLLPGLRYNYDQKEVDFNRQTYGGLETADPALLALKRAVYTDQAFTADVDESNLSGQLTLTYKPAPNINSFAIYSTSYKPVGVNLGGLPTANGEVMTELARVKPEYVNHLEVGVKTTPTANATLNVVFHNTNIRDYQTQVQTAEVGVNRGYLANAERVRVFGVELDGNIRCGS